MSPAADQESISTVPGVPEGAPVSPGADWSERLLADLNSPQCEAVTLHHLQGLSLAELARRMERSEAAVAGLLRRGLQRLRELMEDQE